ncbi:MAG TPA: presqualene diphosphate synthase HpnD [Burkholderiales bacterium]|jgi:phytoene synthase|nr:presqualene diphosphate synthase HpnD [Burkholderiales bacterium]
MTPHEYCQTKAAQSGSSFYYSFLFLPQEQRRAITALYAFCREVDDVVDECSDAGVARVKLAWWRNEVANLYEGRPQHPVAMALTEVTRRFDLPQHRLHEIIDGMEMDLDHNGYPDFAALRLYCHRVASVVGLLSAEIFGYQDPRTLDYAADLGLAFQLTNIIRDVGEDVRRNRIYLPLDELQEHRVSAGEIAAARESDAFRRLMEFQIDRALGFYARALAALPAVDRRSQRAGLVMAAIYRALLDEIRADGCRVLTHRTSLTPIRKLWIAWKTWLKG